MPAIVFRFIQYLRLNSQILAPAFSGGGLLMLALLSISIADGGTAQARDAQARDSRVGVVGTPIVGRASVIDGDTLEVQGERIRLFGIDAPETRQLCEDQSGKPYRCGQRAAFALSDKVGARPVSCQPTGKDRYDRIVARCSLAGEDLQAWMVRNGHALAFGRYSQDYRSHEYEARNRRVGIWTGNFEAPWEWRRRGRT